MTDTRIVEADRLTVTFRWHPCDLNRPQSLPAAKGSYFVASRNNVNDDLYIDLMEFIPGEGWLEEWAPGAVVAWAEIPEIDADQRRNLITAASAVILDKGE